MPRLIRCLDCRRLAPTSPCPECRAARDQDHNAKRAAYHTAQWRRTSRRVVDRDGCCQACGATKHLLAHHIHPREQGGPDSLENLMALCFSCHSRYEADRRAGRRTELVEIIELQYPPHLRT